MNATREGDMKCSNFTLMTCICKFVRFVFNERYNQIDAGTSGHNIEITVARND